MSASAKVFKHLNEILSTFSVKKLKDLITEFKIPVTNKKLKSTVIDSIISYIRKTGKYKQILTEYLGLDTSYYLKKKTKIFKAYPIKRTRIRYLLLFEKENQNI